MANIMQWDENMPAECRVLSDVREVHTPWGNCWSDS